MAERTPVRTEPTTHLEVERKYDVGPDEQLPDLSAVPAVAELAPAVRHELTATYYDTADLRLRAAGATLRRRTGGDDAGWHLKLPAGADREEIGLAEGGDEPPRALQALVRSRARGQELAAVATLSTARTVHRLLADDGRVLVEVADDRVTGTVLPAGAEPAAEPLVWREWEAELVTGNRRLLDDVQEALLAAGATPAGSGSKVGRVLGRLPASDGRPWWADRAVTSRKVTAGGVLQAHLAEQVGELVARDPQVRRDLPDAVHKMRVATRRLRSALRSFRPLLDRTRTDPVRTELAWLAGVLGQARDAEVMHARLRDLVAGQDPDLVVGPVRDRIDTVLGARYRQAHDDVLAELDGPRYLALLDTLTALFADPPLSDAARGRATDVLPAVVRRAEKHVLRLLASASDLPPGAAQDVELHEARKSAKQARYVAEAVAPVYGRDARRWAAAVADLQEVLGTHQDGVVTREALRELALQAHRSGENGFTYGRLHALEQAAADAAAVTWPAALAALRNKQLRKWFARAR